MPTIDGLITGIDTTTVIEGLLEIRKAQIERLEGRKAEIVAKQTSFSGIEARLHSLRGALGRLTTVRNNALQEKLVGTSNEDLITAAAGSAAQVGVYQLSVEQLATSHTIATDAVFESLDAEITTGTMTIQVGSGAVHEIEVNTQNNTLQGLADTINSSVNGVSATIINTNAGATPYRLVLSSQQSGAENQVSVVNNLAASGGAAVRPDLVRVVDAGNNARLTFGTGVDQITIESATNQVDELIPGMTLDLHKAAPGEIVTLTVSRNIEAAKEAVNGMVTAYNDVISYINTQTQFIAETGKAGLLLGDRTVSSIRDDIQFALTGVVQGVNQNLNRLSAVGVTLNSNGTLALNETKLDDALNGRVEGVAADDVLRLFALTGNSSSSGLRYLGGSTRTKTGEMEVQITSAATRAVALATNSAAATTLIDETNDTLQLSLDGQLSSELKLAHGSYDAVGLAAALESAINSDDQLIGRSVTVSLQDGQIQIRSDSFGKSSEISAITGSAMSALGFTGTDTERGQGTDVVGYFVVNGQREDATGSGQLLTGKRENATTADLQVRVTLSESQLQADQPEGVISVTRGIASHLDNVLNQLLLLQGTDDAAPGKIKSANDRYEQLVADIDASIARMNARFDAEQESLIKQFTALETAVAGFQNTASFLSAQLVGSSALAR